MKRGTASKINFFMFLVVLAVIVSRAQPRWQADEFSGKVVGVSDGDTIQVLYQGKEENVRLYGIDCPEKKQAFGQAAKKFSSNLVFGKTVRVEIRDEDRYGRIIGWVTMDDNRVLNIELVKSGMAWWYSEYAPKDGLLKSLEQEARENKRGLWSRKRPVPPWEYRARQRNKSALLYTELNPKFTVAA